MTRTRHLNRSSAALWASAFVIAAFTIMQAGRLPQNAAFAESVSAQGPYTLLTATSGLGGDLEPWELLYVIDSRDQALMVYQIEDARTGRIILRDGGSLVNLFRAARR